MNQPTQRKQSERDENPPPKKRIQTHVRSQSHASLPRDFDDWLQAEREQRIEKVLCGGRQTS